MKSILIIDTPKDCGHCLLSDFIDGDNCLCRKSDRKNNAIEKPSWCPLRPLPEGHGDLIDRKDLIENGLRKGFCDWYDEIKMADAIIESDRGETE